MRKLVTFFVAFFLLSTMSLADTLSNTERTYQIEVIVFSHITAQGLRSEQWPWTPTQYFPKPNTVNLGSGSDNVFTALPNNDFVLATEQRSLEKNQNYQVLLHLAWRQQIVRPRQAQPVHVYGGNIYNASGQIIGKAEYGKQSYNAENIWQVNGTITPSLIRYIGLKFNLLFVQPLSTLPGADKNNNVQGHFAYFRLKQSRRMRSRELNYIGHPLYGILVKVVPVG